MKYQDQHLHYTGSLPLPYVWEKIKEGNGRIIDTALSKELFSKETLKRLTEKEFSNETYSLLKRDIKELFNDTNDYTRNYKTFFKLYKVIQDVTKPKQHGGIGSCYRQGTKAIVSHLSTFGVTNFDVFAGPTLDLEKTKLRILGMIQGFKDNQHLPAKGSLRLTFISAKNGYINLNKKSLEELLNFIVSDKQMADYISGFDFSGNEDVNNINIISSTIDRLFDFNKEYHTRYNKRFKISVHAGENFIDISPEKYLIYFDKLVNLPIDSIGHGVFLWIPNKCVDYPQKINIHRQELLKKVVEKSIELEICPTSNVLFSPLKSYSDIPFELFKNIGLKYSINTDNMTIFSTDIQSEYQTDNM